MKKLISAPAKQFHPSNARVFFPLGAKIMHTLEVLGIYMYYIILYIYTSYIIYIYIIYVNSHVSSMITPCFAASIHSVQVKSAGYGPPTEAPRVA